LVIGTAVGRRRAAPTAETHPGFLQGLVGVAHRSEHPVRHGPQAGPVLFEPLGQPLLVVHGHVSSSRRVIFEGDPRNPVDATGPPTRRTEA
jgi:hypothetical protein